MQHHLMLVRMAATQSLQTVNPEDGVGENAPFCAADGNINRCSHCGEYEGSLKY